MNLVRLSVADGTSDAFALPLPNARPPYSALTGDIFTTLIYPSVPSGTTRPAPPATITAYRLSATGGHLLWSAPGQEEVFQPTAHDAQTLYVETVPPGVISAYRLTDGAVRWHRAALASGTPIVVASGDLVETMSGIDDVCQQSLVHQAPQIRALATASGTVAWTRALDATL